MSCLLKLTAPKMALSTQGLILWFLQQPSCVWLMMQRYPPHTGLLREDPLRPVSPAPLPPSDQVGTRCSPAIPAEIDVSFQIATQSDCVTNGNIGNLAHSPRCC